MLGSGAAEPVAVCDIAVSLRLHSNAVDRIAIAEGATKLDNDLMIISAKSKTDFRPDAYTVPHIFNYRSLKAVAMSVPNIASFRCDANLTAIGGIADIGQPSPINLEL